MGSLIGFVSIPRPAESLRSAGAFFSAHVVAKLGPQTWQVKLDGRSVVVTTSLELAPGQNLRLKLVSQQHGRWVLQTVPVAFDSRSPQPSEANPLMAAFLSRGLPLAAEKLAAWARWLGPQPRVSDREAWAASLESRGQSPHSSLAQGLESWLAWQASLEDGHPRPPPEDSGYWDLWNSRATASGDPWLVVPLHWVHEGGEDSGLLQAHWNPQARAIDRWHLTASPAGVPFRLEAHSQPARLELTWRFFREADRRAWHALAATLASGLSRADLTVDLRVAGKPDSEPLLFPGGIDVEA